MVIVLPSLLISFPFIVIGLPVAFARTIAMALEMGLLSDCAVFESLRVCSWTFLKMVFSIATWTRPFLFSILMSSAISRSSRHEIGCQDGQGIEKRSDKED